MARKELIFLTLGLQNPNTNYNRNFSFLNVYLMQVITHKPDGISCMTEQHPHLVYPF